ncbi:MAG: OsmC family protein [Myxococcales bacterium]|nr:OsmC family protein [Myxococcales bacterium]
MSEHAARVDWTRKTPDFAIETYDRNHLVQLGNGTTFTASAAAEFRGDARQTNPEELFVSSLSSCHMLTFLAVAARAGLVVDRYVDEAVGYLEKNEAGKLSMNRVVLRPRVEFGAGADPSPDEVYKLHERAHHGCFIANSIASHVTIEPMG